MENFQRKAHDFLAEFFGGQKIEEKQNLMRVEEEKEEKTDKPKTIGRINEAAIEEIKKD